MAQGIFPVILCGGSGTRLWPVSRAMYPKQFISFFNAIDDSLLSLTVRRVSNGGRYEPLTILCNNDHRFLIQNEIENAGGRANPILLEPVARNTAPAITVAALHLMEQSPDAILAVMPSDHVIGDTDAFSEAIAKAAAIASEGRLVLFGIRPTAPKTEYGYIRAASPNYAAGEHGSFDVEAFVEKPDLARAEQYLSDGRYFWNSGIFILHARTFLEEVERLAPEIIEPARAALAGAQPDLGFLRLDASAYAQCPNISIDYAVMEKTSKAVMVPFESGWSDVGSWSSMWDVAERDADGNAVKGDALLWDTTNSYIHSERSLISTIGVEDLIIVQTPDATLVSKKDRAQDVGKIVAKLKNANRREHEQHVRNYRPWGHFETLNIGPRFQVKLLHVKPGGKLSLQMHHHRSEHWIVVKGTAKVTCEETEKLVCENESVYISATQWHRLENPGKVPLELIEVQLGSYLGEDDIVRKEDIYRRSDDETK